MKVESDVPRPLPTTIRYLYDSPKCVMIMIHRCLRHYGHTPPVHAAQPSSLGSRVR